MHLNRLSHWALICTLSVVPVGFAAHAQDDAAAQSAHSKTKDDDKDNDRDVRSNAALWAKVQNPVLWHEPGNIAALDLYWGAGGKTNQPKSPFVFLSEDSNGTNAKLDVRDANGTKWRVKEGEEAQPEVAASRLLWAMGYYANEDYLVPGGQVQNIKMKRGSQDLKDRGTLVNVRFARKPDGQKKIGIWEWKTSPFYGSREFNGLRVMMAVINNWDLKDVNNAVYMDSKNNRQIFLVSDIGASFGSNGVSWTRSRSKGNVDSFRSSGFIQSKTNSTVSFSTPKKPTGMLLATMGATAKSFAMRKDMDWIGNDIPIQDVRWMGGLLGQLSHKQLTDAFRAANFSEDEVQAYVELVESRITELKKL
ncbi:hypothetical protein [Terriglobus sp. TAA 43]|uniref:hypothetical protein n=1 Tax=Terriglobus sp. TAA 43 TaxID=278961 RepID=UPI000647C0F8|nr:hypothetical protein [Terriglobus sp. TAA 43]